MLGGGDGIAHLSPGRQTRGWFMDLKTVLSEVGTWPVEDRLQLVEEVWGGLHDEAYEPELTDDLRAKIDRRLAALDANPQNVTTWEEIQQYVRRPR